MSVQVIMALRCHWCSQQYPPTHLMAFSSNQLMCRQCYEKHQAALRLLAGQAMPEGCHLCGVPLAVLNGLSNGPTTRMYVINIDQAYAVACGVCKDDYMRKRADLVRGTAYGKELNL